jgi:hypothetical protein
LGSDIDGKVLGAHPDVDAGVMAGDRCIHVRRWSGKGKDLTNEHASGVDDDPL